MEEAVVVTAARLHQVGSALPLTGHESLRSLNAMFLSILIGKVGTI